MIDAVIAQFAKAIVVLNRAARIGLGENGGGFPGSIEGAAKEPVDRWRFFREHTGQGDRLPASQRGQTFIGGCRYRVRQIYQTLPVTD